MPLTAEQLDGIMLQKEFEDKIAFKKCPKCHRETTINNVELPNTTRPDSHEGAIISYCPNCESSFQIFTEDTVFSDGTVVLLS